MSYAILVTPRAGGSFRPADVSATLAAHPQLRRLSWDHFQSAGGLEVQLIADTATEAVDSLVLQIPLGDPPAGFDCAFDLALLLSDRLDAVLLDAQTGHEVSRDARDSVRAKALEASTWAARLGHASNAATRRAPAAQMNGAPRATPSLELARRPWWRFWAR